MAAAQLDPRLHGYQKWDGVDPFEDQSGPYYFKQAPDGSYLCAFIAEDRHMNGQGNMHGGALMTFADYVMFVVARPVIEHTPAITVTCNSEFTSSASSGDFVEGTGEIVHETGSMVFIRGKILVGVRTLLNFSGVLKKVRSKK